jgi:glycosyltransferase involved in cell wall biosynthesis
MPQPFFSIVIPTFNRSELFPYAVRSILQQSFENYEIIVSDNFSGDDTPQVAKQFTDARFKYVQTPRHFTIADAWEFARSRASGKFIMMLSDDDALVHGALERFAHESTRYDADFLFSSAAEYRDASYPGADRNSVDCPSFSGSSRVVHADEFIRPLFAFRLKFNMHPSAFIFPKKIADHVKECTGRFFWTNGVEYSAWPITAVFAKRIVFIDLPLIILGRTGKSWGSNIALCNPGKERIQEFIKDVDHERKHAPLNNFTMCNLMAEGMLTAKSLFPKEFEAYEFDEVRYLRSSMGELRKRQTLGVDVSKEIQDVIRYASKHPGLTEEFEGPPEAVVKNTLKGRIRSKIGDLGVRTVRKRIAAYQLARKLEQGGACAEFSAFGKDFGFSDILGCIEFLGRYLPTTPKKPVYEATSYSPGETTSER